MSERPPVDILLVDDNPAKILALETSLAPLGQNLVSAGSGREALRHLLERDFATVILDVHMPGLDGFETAQLIRGRERSAHTPIIFVSAINLADTDALRGYALGAVDYIFAPIIPEVLRAKVSVFVELHRKTEEARRHAAEVEERTRQLEESQHQLRLAERMAALGTLSAGVGHDMGNLLLPIQARLEALDLDTLPEDAREALDGIRTCIAHLRRLADGLRLLAFDSRREATAEDSVELAPWWEELEPVLRNVLPTGVVLEGAIGGDLARPLIAKHLLTQVVFNLVQNAGDALRARGRGLVRVWATPCDGGGRLRIGVSDDGPGMSEEVQRRCLEPFFTTKLRGISTGLGLSLVHGILRRAGGGLTVTSAEGQGSTFSFEIAAREPGCGRTSAAVVSSVCIADPRLRSLVSALLGRCGAVVRHEPEPGPDASLWISAAGEGDAERAAAFVTAAGRRAVLLGADPGGVAPHERLAVVAPPVRPSDLRRAICEAVDGCALDAAPAAETAAVGAAGPEESAPREIARRGAARAPQRVGG